MITLNARHISQQRLDKIQHAAQSNNEKKMQDALYMGKWDKIKDFFSSTGSEKKQAMDAFMLLYRETTPIDKKIEAFITLHQLAGQQGKNCFYIETKNVGPVNQQCNYPPQGYQTHDGFLLKINDSNNKDISIVNISIEPEYTFHNNNQIASSQIASSSWGDRINETNITYLLSEINKIKSASTLINKAKNVLNHIQQQIYIDKNNQLNQLNQLKYYYDQTQKSNNKNNQLTQELQKSNDNNTQLTQNVNNLEKEIKRKENIINNKESIINEKGNENKELETEKVRLQNVNKKYNSNNLLLREKNNEQKENIINLEKKLEEIEKNLKEKEKGYDSMSNLCIEYVEKSDKQQEEIEKLNEELINTKKNLEDKIKNLEKTNKNITSEKKGLTKKINELEEQIGAIKSKPLSKDFEDSAFIPNEHLGSVKQNIDQLKDIISSMINTYDEDKNFILDEVIHSIQKKIKLLNPSKDSVKSEDTKNQIYLYDETIVDASEAEKTLEEIRKIEGSSSYREVEAEKNKKSHKKVWSLLQNKENLSNNTLLNKLTEKFNIIKHLINTKKELIYSYHLPSKEENECKLKEYENKLHIINNEITAIKNEKELPEKITLTLHQYDEDDNLIEKDSDEIDYSPDEINKNKMTTAKGWLNKGKIPFATMSACVHQGCKRENQEDRIILPFFVEKGPLKDYMIQVALDGHGGYEVSEYVRKNLPGWLNSINEGSEYIKNGQLTNAFFFMIQKEVINHVDAKETGTTLSLAQLSPKNEKGERTVTLYTLGDARGIIVQNGQPLFTSFDMKAKNVGVFNIIKNDESDEDDTNKFRSFMNTYKKDFISIDKNTLPEINFFYVMDKITALEKAIEEQSKSDTKDEAKIKNLVENLNTYKAYLEEPEQAQEAYQYINKYYLEPIFKKHAPLTSDEKKEFLLMLNKRFDQLKENDVEISDGYAGSVAVGTTIGDTHNFKEDGENDPASYLPHVRQFTLPANSDGPIYFITITDGITDGFTNKQIAQFIQDNDRGDGALAQKVTQQAINKGSQDNLGIIITKLQ